jgi:hypothetical protein
MKKTISVEELWLDYSKKTMAGIPTNSNQYTECKRVYFCGVAEGLFILKEIVGDPSVSEGEGVEILQSIHAQIEDFLQRECDDFNRKR